MLKKTAAYVLLGALASLITNKTQVVIAGVDYSIVVFLDGCIRSDDGLSYPPFSYTGPTPGSGNKLCVIDKTRLLMCNDLDAYPTDTGSEPYKCPKYDSYKEDLLMCPSLKGITYGFSCDELQHDDNYDGDTPQSGDWLCAVYDDDKILGCQELKPSGKYTFLSGGPSRRLEEIEGKETVAVTEKNSKGVRKIGKEALFLGQDVEETMVGKEGNDEEFFKLQRQPLNDKWYMCFFRDGRLKGCEDLDNGEFQVPQPYWMYSGIHLVEARQSLYHANGWITVTGLEVALANTINYFGNFFMLY